MNCSDASDASRRRFSFASFASLLLAALRAYQAFISPLLPSACKFYPSCSNYAVEAIEQCGVRRGAWLAFRRLVRCRPFSSGGWDPVPQGSAAGSPPNPVRGAGSAPQGETGQ